MAGSGVFLPQTDPVSGKAQTGSAAGANYSPIDSKTMQYGAPAYADWTATMGKGNEYKGWTEQQYNNWWGGLSPEERWSTDRQVYEGKLRNNGMADTTDAMTAWGRSHPYGAYDDPSAGTSAYDPTWQYTLYGTAPKPKTEPQMPDFNPNAWGQPGALETAWDQHGGNYWQTPNSVNFWNGSQNAINNPGMAETYAQGAATRYAGGTPGVSNALGDYYSGFGSRRPELSANLDPFYDNAERRAGEKLRAELAAKGMYSSSGADDQTREMLTNFEAQKAKDEAQYGIERSNALLGWETQGGTEARGVDEMSNTRSQNERDWMTALSNATTAGQAAENTRLTTGGTLSQNADNAWLSALNGGFNAADRTQAATNAREDDAWTRQFDLAKALAGIYGGYGDTTISSDKETMDDATKLATGEGLNAVNQGYRNQEQGRQNIMDILNLSKLFGGGSS